MLLVCHWPGRAVNQLMGHSYHMVFSHWVVAAFHGCSLALGVMIVRLLHLLLHLTSRRPLLMHSNLGSVEEVLQVGRCVYG